MEKDFDLEKNINIWKKDLRKSIWIDDGMIAELEIHLRDHIEDLVYEGFSIQHAFNKAVQDLGTVDQIGDEESRNILVHQSGNRIDLWINFLRVNLRRIFRYRVYNFINIFGLALGITGFLLISFYLFDEWSYDKMHPDFERIYRLSYIRITEDGQRQPQAYSSPGWAPILKEQHAGVEDFCRIKLVSHAYLSTNDEERIFYTEGIYFADSNFFQMFSFQLKKGLPGRVIQNPNSIVLTESSAEKYFGDQDPVGHLMIFRQGTSRQVNLTVTGVMYDPPSNTQFQPEFVASFESLRSFYGTELFERLNQYLPPAYTYSYLKIPSSQNKNGIVDKLNAVLTEGLGKEEASRIEPLLTPLADIHFYNPPMRWEFDHSTSNSYLNGLIFIAISILIIAMLNFINLSTAQAMQKGKEVGVRTILGSSKFNIRFQFILETMILVVAAMLLSFLIIYLIFPYYLLLTEKNFTLADLMGNFEVLGILSGIVLVTGFLASIYPSLYLSRINPLTVLKMLVQKGRGSHLIRKGLVTLQFSIALIMIISTIVIYKQLNLINNGALASNRNHIISIRTRLMGTIEQTESFRQEILRDSRIMNASLGMHLPRQADFGRIDTKFMVKELGKDNLFWNKFQSDGFFPQTFDLDFVAGHDFTDDVDSSSLILNEAAVRSLGLTPAEAIGLFIEEDSIGSTYTHITGTVIGVVKDFPYTSIKKNIAPLLMISNLGTEGVLSVKLTPGNITDKIRFLENKWKQIFPARPFEYWFMDDQFDRLYFQERRLGKLVPVFTGLTVIIALMGLFALTIFMTEQRNKEIGIRKVLGSTTGQIIRLLSWDFMQLVLLSMLIGIPVAILIMKNWLDNFAYKTHISVGDILVTVAFVSLVSFITISYKAIRSARTNPARSLRSE